MRKILALTISLLFLFSLSANAQMRNFIGNWTNTNSSTSGMTKLHITANGNNAYVNAWGQCSPSDCNWGRTSATKYYSGVSSNTVSGLSGNYSSSGIRRMVILKMQGNTLQAQVLKQFSGGNRQNTIQNYTFRKVRNTALNVPVLVSPRNNARFTNFPRRTTVDWRPVSGADAYGVEVEYYDRGSRRWIGNYKKERVNRTNYTFNFIGDQAGRWRVWAIRGNSTSRKSAWRTFSYSTSASTILRAPVQTSPANGVVYNRFPRTTRLNWRPVSGASYYMVEIEYYSGGRWQSNYKLDRSNNTQHTFRFVGAQPGRWRVWAVSGNGTAGRKSVWRTFRYTR